jgi:hypothetical protein
MRLELQPRRRGGCGCEERRRQAERKRCWAPRALTHLGARPSLLAALQPRRRRDSAAGTASRPRWRVPAAWVCCLRRWRVPRWARAMSAPQRRSASRHARAASRTAPANCARAPGGSDTPCRPAATAGANAAGVIISDGARCAEQRTAAQAAAARQRALPQRAARAERSRAAQCGARRGECATSAAMRHAFDAHAPRSAPASLSAAMPLTNVSTSTSSDSEKVKLASQAPPCSMWAKLRVSLRGCASACAAGAAPHWLQPRAATDNAAECAARVAAATEAPRAPAKRCLTFAAQLPQRCRATAQAASCAMRARAAARAAAAPAAAAEQAALAAGALRGTRGQRSEGLEGLLVIGWSSVRWSGRSVGSGQAPGAVQNRQPPGHRALEALISRPLVTRDGC